MGATARAQPQRFEWLVLAFNHLRFNSFVRLFLLQLGHQQQGGCEICYSETAKMDMYHPSSRLSSQEEMLNNLNRKGIGEPYLVLTSDPKPRLRWTADLHDRFVDAVTQLGGPNSRISFFFFQFIFFFNYFFLGFCSSPLILPFEPSLFMLH